MCRGCCCYCTAGCCFPQSRCAHGLEIQSGSTRCSGKGSGLLQRVRQRRGRKRQGGRGGEEGEGHRKREREKGVSFTEVSQYVQVMATPGGGPGPLPSHQSPGKRLAVPLTRSKYRRPHGSTQPRLLLLPTTSTSEKLGGPLPFSVLGYVQEMRTLL